MPPPPELRRAVSRGQVVGLAINDVVGSGIYLLPAAAAALLGPASLTVVVAVAIRARRPLWRGRIVVHHAQQHRPVPRKPDLWTPEEGI